MITFLIVLAILILLIAITIVSRIRKFSVKSKIDPVKEEIRRKAELFDQWVQLKNNAIFIQ